jgi:hypothetical protein
VCANRTSSRRGSTEGRTLNWIADPPEFPGKINSLQPGQTPKRTQCPGIKLTAAHQSARSMDFYN